MLSDIKSEFFFQKLPIWYYEFQTCYFYVGLVLAFLFFSIHYLILCKSIEYNLAKL